uniref:Uncharacterized protein n=1 Tax=Alexandrium monilatum TaxID=311494 RepID=A0A6T1ECE3_9DINO
MTCSQQSPTACPSGGLATGARVRVQNLQARPEFNGEEGALLDYSPEEGRWRVVLRNGCGLSVRPDTLAPASGLEVHTGPRPLRVRVTGVEDQSELNGREGTLCEQSRADNSWRVVLDGGGGINLRSANLDLLLSSDDEEWVYVEAKDDCNAGSRQMPEAKKGPCYPDSGQNGGALDDHDPFPPAIPHTMVADVQPGSEARITGLAARPDIDGRIAKLLEYIDEEGRWKVQLKDSDETKFIKAEHLRIRPDDALSALKPKPTCVAGAPVAPEPKPVRVAGGPSAPAEVAAPPAERAPELEQGIPVAALTRGMHVRVIGLQNRPELNGLEGRLLRYVDKGDRWQVRMDDGSGKLLKPGNLEAVQTTSDGAASAESSKDMGVASAVAADTGAAARAGSSQGSAGPSPGTRAPDLRERFQNFLRTGERLCIPEYEPCKRAVPSCTVPAASESACRVPAAADAGERGAAPARDAPAASEGARLGGEGPAGSSAEAPSSATGPARASSKDCLQTGDRVRVQGLKAKPELNGQLGRLLELTTEEGRWRVVMDDGSGYSLRPANLARMGVAEAGGGSASSADHLEADQRPSANSGERTEQGLAAGTRVVVKDLKARPDMNGRHGRLLAYNEAEGRWRVVMDDGSGLSLRPANLRRDVTDGPAASSNQRGEPQIAASSGAGSDAAGSCAPASVIPQRFYDSTERGVPKCMPGSAHGQASATHMGGSSSSSSVPGRLPAHFAGQRVRVKGMLSRPELNGQLGCLLERDVDGSSRWRVVTDSGQGLSLRPANLEGLDGAGAEPADDNATAQHPSSREVPASAAGLDPLLQAGSWVHVKGLTGRPELNGQSGSLLEFDVFEGRWRVMLDSGSGFSLRPANLEPARPCAAAVGVDSPGPAGGSLGAMPATVLGPSAADRGSGTTSAAVDASSAVGRGPTAAAARVAADSASGGGPVAAPTAAADAAGRRPGAAPATVNAPSAAGRGPGAVPVKVDETSETWELVPDA